MHERKRQKSIVSNTSLNGPLLLKPGNAKSLASTFQRTKQKQENLRLVCGFSFLAEVVQYCQAVV